VTTKPAAVISVTSAFRGLFAIQFKNGAGLDHHRRPHPTQAGPPPHLARHLTHDLRRPWEKPVTEPHRLTPARIRRGFRNLRPKTILPASAPKPSRPGSGRPPGTKNRQPATDTTSAKRHHQGQGRLNDKLIPTSIILDCDPGHDDAMAILLAAGSDKIDLRALTTVAGNHVLEKVTLNARRMLSLAGVTDVPVAAGYAKPLLGELVIAAHVHGDNGLEGWDFAEPTIPQHPVHAVELMSSVLTRSPDPVTLVSTGPQTNIAALLLAAPHLREHIREIVCLGGSTHRGNTLPYSEYNVFVDPEAARLVLASGVPVTYCGLNVTHQAVVTPTVLAHIHAAGPIGECAAALLRYRSGTYNRLWSLPHAPLHDPLAIAIVIDPFLVHSQDANVEIELRGEFTRGATVIDLLGITGRPTNARVAINLNTERLWKLMISALHNLTVSPRSDDSGLMR
jgi:purine nucleosidase/pyrimidine-specific ribonucleoside hydrolase